MKTGIILLKDEFGSVNPTIIAGGNDTVLEYADIELRIHIALDPPQVANAIVGHTTPQLNLATASLYLWNEMMGVFKLVLLVRVSVLSAELAHPTKANSSENITFFQSSTVQFLCCLPNLNLSSMCSCSSAGAAGLTNAQIASASR